MFQLYSLLIFRVMSIHKDQWKYNAWNMMLRTNALNEKTGLIWNQKTAMNNVWLTKI